MTARRAPASLRSDRRPLPVLLLLRSRAACSLLLRSCWRAPCPPLRLCSRLPPPCRPPEAAAVTTPSRRSSSGSSSSSRRTRGRRQRRQAAAVAEGLSAQAQLPLPLLPHPPSPPPRPRRSLSGWRPGRRTRSDAAPRRQPRQTQRYGASPRSRQRRAGTRSTAGRPRCCSTLHPGERRETSRTWGGTRTRLPSPARPSRFPAAAAVTAEQQQRSSSDRPCRVLRRSSSCCRPQEAMGRATEGGAARSLPEVLRPVAAAVGAHPGWGRQACAIGRGETAVAQVPASG